MITDCCALLWASVSSPYYSRVAALRRIPMKSGGLYAVLVRGLLLYCLAVARRVPFLKNMSCSTGPIFIVDRTELRCQDNLWAERSRCVLTTLSHGWVWIRNRFRRDVEFPFQFFEFFFAACEVYNDRFPDHITNRAIIIRGKQPQIGELVTRYLEAEAHEFTARCLARQFFYAHIPNLQVVAGRPAWSLGADSASKLRYGTMVIPGVKWNLRVSPGSRDSLHAWAP